MCVVAERCMKRMKSSELQDRKITPQPGNEPARSFDTVLEEKKFSDVHHFFNASKNILLRPKQKLLHPEMDHKTCPD